MAALRAQRRLVEPYRSADPSEANATQTAPVMIKRYDAPSGWISPTGRSLVAIAIVRANAAKPRRDDRRKKSEFDVAGGCPAEGEGSENERQRTPRQGVVGGCRRGPAGRPKDRRRCRKERDLTALDGKDAHAVPLREEASGICP